MNTNTEDCKNCGAALTGAYCHQCGQRADEPRRVVIGLVQDFLVDTLAIDGKLARSLGLLLWRPGRLARRYLDGRRVYYSPPFRLYLFASVFFFLTAFTQFDDLLFDNAPIGNAAAYPFGGNIGHIHLLCGFSNLVLDLLFCANKQYLTFVLDDGIDCFGSLIKRCDGFFQINNMNTLAFSKDVILHRGVPF